MNNDPSEQANWLYNSSSDNPSVSKPPYCQPSNDDVVASCIDTSSTGSPIVDTIVTPDPIISASINLDEDEESYHLTDEYLHTIPWGCSTVLDEGFVQSLQYPHHTTAHSEEDQCDLNPSYPHSWYTLQVPQHGTNPITSLQDVVHCVQNSKQILIVSGAGISVAAGIPDFRSIYGIYNTLKNTNVPEISDWLVDFDVDNLFNLETFLQRPQPFYTFLYTMLLWCKDIQPTRMHQFFHQLQRNNQLLRIYTQNVDMLEKKVGIDDDKLLFCHGSAHTYTCMTCRRKVSGECVWRILESQTNKCEILPCCYLVDTFAQGSSASSSTPTTLCTGLLKPDIIFYGESLSSQIFTTIQHDAAICDLVLVVGTSLTVSPVNTFLQLIPTHVPIINISREPILHLPFVYMFSYQCIGDADTVAQALLKGITDSADDVPSIPQNQTTNYSSDVSQSTDTVVSASQADRLVLQFYEFLSDILHQNLYTSKQS
uniref:NAD-dependent deacetylase HST1 n=1 Tax=Lygus hesperus TaxID=30085 RepID=A0A0A9YF61_LYGHE